MERSFVNLVLSILKQLKRRTPTCNEEFSSFADKGLKRSLYTLKVRCSHQKDGCEWTEELRQLDEHLNTDPQPEKQLDGCQFVEMDCIYNCGNKLQRRYIQNHQIKDCPKRPFGCEHCHDYKSTCDDVTNNHWPVCGFFPVPCPNQCGSTIQRQYIDSHVADECPLTTINCDFHHVGCAVKLPRQDMPEHVNSSLSAHMSLLASSHAKLMLENERSLTALQTKVTTLEQENTTSNAEIRSSKTNLTALQTTLEGKNKLLTTSITKQKADIANLVEENKQLRIKITELEPLQQMLKTAPPIVNSRPLGAPVLTMTNYQQHKRDDDRWFSPPVYTHHQGYKICLNVFADGASTSKGNVSVYCTFMRGEFDDSLKWPFRGAISYQLLDQVNGENHKTRTIFYDDKVPNNYCARVTERYQQEGGENQSSLLTLNWSPSIYETTPFSSKYTK